MAGLKDKATKSSSSGALSKKAQSRGLGGGEKNHAEDIREPAQDSGMAMPGVAGQAPPLPPSLMYLRYFATIPGLRKGGGSAQ